MSALQETGKLSDVTGMVNTVLFAPFVGKDFSPKTLKKVSPLLKAPKWVKRGRNLFDVSPI
jgi:hypothetical protein